MALSCDTFGLRYFSVCHTYLVEQLQSNSLYFLLQPVWLGEACHSFVSTDRHRQPASACGPISYSSTDVELETKTFWILINTFWNDIRQLNDKIWAKIFQPASVTCPDSDLSTNSQLPLPHPSNHLFVFSTHLRCAQKKLLINEFSKRCENG